MELLSSEFRGRRLIGSPSFQARFVGVPIARVVREEAEDCPLDTSTLSKGPPIPLRCGTGLRRCVCHPDQIALVRGTHHIAFVTADIDRLVAFYERVFDAQVIGDREDRGRRHALIALGDTVLHPFEIPADRVPGRQPMFERGRLDHVALEATSEDAFLEIRRRLIEEEAHATEDGLVTDMGGSVWSFSFHDPDGMWGEVMWIPPGASLKDVKRPPEWEMIDPS